MSQEHEQKKVHVTAFYTSTAEEKRFNAERERTVQKVIDEAYDKLGEQRRDGDQYFCHAEPRIDLTPHLNSTLASLAAQGICVQDNGHGKLDFELDIDVVPGGA